MLLEELITHAKERRFERIVLETASVLKEAISRGTRHGLVRRDTLRDPEHGDRTDHVRRYQHSPARRPPQESSAQRDHGDDGCDEQQLSNLDPDVEREQRNGYRLLRQPDLGKGTGEPEAVEQAERECNQPWRTRCETRFAS